MIWIWIVVIYIVGFFFTSWLSAAMGDEDISAAFMWPALLAIMIIVAPFVILMVASKWINGTLHKPWL